MTPGAVIPAIRPVIEAAKTRHPWRFRGCERHVRTPSGSVSLTSRASHQCTLRHRHPSFLLAVLLLLHGLLKRNITVYRKRVGGSDYGASRRPGSEAFPVRKDCRQDVGNRPLSQGWRIGLPRVTDDQAAGQPRNCFVQPASFLIVD